MNIPTLVIEREARVGDTWRKRYPTLVLHTIRRHHTCKCLAVGLDSGHSLRRVVLYQQFPSNWPEYTPRDKLADWLEHYASIEDLVVWTNSELKPRPTYNAEDHRWDVTVIRNGAEVKLRPVHIVLATGTLGRPIVPEVPGIEAFQGRVVHSSRFPGGAQFSGHHAVVVGAGNSSIDICQDLALRGAASVTMVQRSTSCVMSLDFISDNFRKTYSEDVPLEVADLRFFSMSLALRKRMAIENQALAWEAHKELHGKLRKGGVSFNLGPEGQGVPILVFERLGGECLYHVPGLFGAKPICRVQVIVSCCACLLDRDY